MAGELGSIDDQAWPRQWNYCKMLTCLKKVGLQLVKRLSLT